MVSPAPAGRPGRSSAKMVVFAFAARRVPVRLTFEAPVTPAQVVAVASWLGVQHAVLEAARQPHRLVWLPPHAPASPGERVSRLSAWIPSRLRPPARRRAARHPS